MRVPEDIAAEIEAALGEDSEQESFEPPASEEEFEPEDTQLEIDMRPLNYEEAHDDYNTLYHCCMCSGIEKIDSAKIPYVAATCFQHWGINAGYYWKVWMRHEFFSTLKLPKLPKRRTRFARTVRVIEAAFKVELTAMQVRYVRLAIDDAFWQGRKHERKYFEVWRERMRVAVLKLVKSMLETPPTSPPVEAPIQMTLELFRGK